MTRVRGDGLTRNRNIQWVGKYLTHHRVYDNQDMNHMIHSVHTVRMAGKVRRDHMGHKGHMVRMVCMAHSGASSKSMSCNRDNTSLHDFLKLYKFIWKYWKHIK